MTKSIYDAIIEPVITEKALRLQADQNKYVFRALQRANKVDIKTAIETIYKVNVVKVNVINVRSKSKRVRNIPGKTRSWKKVIVTLKDGQKIDLI